MKRLFIFLLLCLCVPVASAKTHVEILDENARSIVAVNVAKTDGSTFTGTGFVVAPDGIIATSRHVIENSLLISVTFNTGAVSDTAKIIATLNHVDLALIKINAQNLPTVTLGYSDTVLPGEEITVIGNPRRLRNTVTAGLISQVRKKSNGVIWHQISAPISPSSSGSPVFNREGEVISIAFSTYQGAGNQNLNFSVPSNYLINLMQSNGLTPPFQTTPGDQTNPIKEKESILERFLRKIKSYWFN